MTNRDAFLFLLIAAIIAGVSAIPEIGPPFALVLLVAFIGLICFETFHRKREGIKAIHYQVQDEPHFIAPKAGEWDRRIRTIRNLQKTIGWLVEQHQQDAVIKAIGPDILFQTQELVSQAEKIYLGQRRLWIYVSESKITESRVADLELELEDQTDARLASTLQLTLASKKSELENVQRLAKDARYLEALLEQAEATLSELRSRIGLTVAQSEEYVNPDIRSALAESSTQINSVSEAMRKTLVDLKTFN